MVHNYRILYDKLKLSYINPLKNNQLKEAKEDNMLKLRFVLMISLLSAGLVLLGGSQIWAKPPCEAVRIFDGGEYGSIQVLFDPDTCEVVEVYICDDEHITPGECADWGAQVAPVQGTSVICTCTVNDDAPSGTQCDHDDLKYNIDHPELFTVDCHDIKSVGPRSSGCPIFGSTVYGIGGDIYYRRR